MKNQRVARRAPLALATALSLAVSPALPLLAGQAAAPAAKPSPAKSPAPPAAAAAPKAPAAAPTPAPIDGGWPRAYVTPSGGRVVVYQPQVASWADQKRMVAYAAVSWAAKGAEKPAIGSIKLETDTKVSTEERLVNYSILRITESHFPSVPRDQIRELVAEIEDAIPQEQRVIALDRVLAGLDRSQITPKEVPGVKADPPTIHFSQTPAVVVNLDGDPIWSPILGNDLKFAVNTNWDLFEHTPTKTYFLRNGDNWLQAPDWKGPWSPPAGKLPESFTKLPADANWQEVKAALPGKKVAPEKAAKVFVSTAPAELIRSPGRPPTRWSRARSSAG